VNVILLKEVTKTKEAYKMKYASFIFTSFVD